ncbi:UvrD-helicase domain-containing protein [Cytobacillus kochii]|uniref:UvrD-helicase domain-containing protein n=1 Tax=Cytobacillus kochii TaxID=859143 RepID=UPI001CD64EBA|nr:UvrD-helicase domain-containing protein [Cytobacillus kochii]MCA1024460.1 UvrD-helicase domain-containing protein [Cytobacillus kochii]
MISISTEDIMKGESIFLPNGDTFSEEKRSILCCLETKDIVACPGSGKTTTLLTKLSIIGDHLHELNNKGICVLTHTNIAIDEIRERLNADSKKLFDYPNYFGTIQSFINQYLALPFFRNQYNKNVVSIDDEKYFDEVKKRYYTLEYGVRYGLIKTFKTQENVFKYLNDIHFHSENDTLVNGMGKPLYKSEGKISIALMEMKKGIIEDGILSYHDAYYLALKYMDKCESQLRSFFSERFAFVFIDEMQDTSPLQLNILNRVFDKGKLIMQRFGDPNQAIYGDSEEMAWDIGQDPLKITNSNRNSPVISKLIAPFELLESGMNGNDHLAVISPKIIVYDTENINEVLPRFAKLIISNRLHNIGNNKFKAVGRIGKDNGDERIKIPSYFQEYIQKRSAVGPKFVSDYLNKHFIDPHSDSDVKTYRNAILAALLRMVSILGIRTDRGIYYSKKSFLTKVKEHDPMLYDTIQGELMKWCLKVRREEDVREEFIEFSKGIITLLFGNQPFEKLKSFFEGTQFELEVSQSSLNIFSYTCDEGITINIDIDTIAGVKGETHTATLFLETFHYNYDVGSLINSFKGYKKEKRGKREQVALKNAYVAMSRPSHLLCVAAQRSSIEGHEEELKKVGWEIVEVISPTIKEVSTN